MPRSFPAAIVGLLAALLLPRSLVSVWVHEVVSDTDRYVETVTPLADDEAVKAAAVTELVVRDVVPVAWAVAVVLTLLLARRDVAQAVWDVVVLGLWRQLEVCGPVAAAVAVLAWLVGRIRGPSRLSSDGAATSG